MIASSLSVVLAFLRRAQTRFIALGAGRNLSHGKDLHIGARTRIWAPNRVQFGDHVYIGKDVHIEANCIIGNYCLIANRVAIVGRLDHDFTAVGFPVRYAPWVGSANYPKPKSDAIIEDDVWIGFGAIVLTGTKVGRGAIVAAGSVVASDIPPYSIAAGVPAKVVGTRFAQSSTIAQHEAAIATGEFSFSERGIDHCVIRPNLQEFDSAP